MQRANRQDVYRQDVAASDNRPHVSVYVSSSPSRQDTLIHTPQSRPLGRIHSPAAQPRRPSDAPEKEAHRYQVDARLIDGDVGGEDVEQTVVEQLDDLGLPAIVDELMDSDCGATHLADALTRYISLSVCVCVYRYTYTYTFIYIYIYTCLVLDCWICD